MCEVGWSLYSQSRIRKKLINPHIYNSLDTKKCLEISYLTA